MLKSDKCHHTFTGHFTTPYKFDFSLVFRHIVTKNRTNW